MILEKRNDWAKSGFNWLVIEMKKMDLLLYIFIYIHKSSSSFGIATRYRLNGP